MRKTITPSLFALLAAVVPATAGAEIVYDFIPTVEKTFFQEIPTWNEETQSTDQIPQTRFDVKFPDEVWWISGASSHCYLLDAEGNRIDWGQNGIERDFSGSSSDYSVFYFGVNGINKYVDTKYTLVIPEGLYGDTEWNNSGNTTGRANPELRYEFNEWELAGKPREDFTVYDLVPTIKGKTVRQIREQGRKIKELLVRVYFPKEAMALNPSLKNLWSIHEVVPEPEPGEETSTPSQLKATLKAEVDKHDPSYINVTVRDLAWDSDVNYIITGMPGCFGTQEWLADDCYSGHACQAFEIACNPKTDALNQITFDFTPTFEPMTFQEYTANDEVVKEVCIHGLFPDEVWWISGVSGTAYVLDKDGNKVDWTPNWSGPASNYSMFYFNVCGFSQYVDADYTLVVPEGVFGDTEWNTSGNTKGRANPEIRIDFNPWKVAGCPRENFTVYDLVPKAIFKDVYEIRDKGRKIKEGLIKFQFPSAMAINSDVEHKWSLWEPVDNPQEGEPDMKYVNNATMTASIDETDNSIVVIKFQGINFSADKNFEISFGKGAFGTVKWAEEDYCEDQANAEFREIFNPVQVVAGIDQITIGNDSESAVYNLQGVRVNTGNLPAGVYISNGRKFVVK